MGEHFSAALGASLLAGLVTTIGIYVIRHFEAWGRKNTTYFSCFAAGVLISVSFLHIIPKSFDMNDHAPWYLLGGYLALHFCLIGSLRPMCVTKTPSRRLVSSQCLA